MNIPEELDNALGKLAAIIVVIVIIFIIIYGDIYVKKQIIKAAIEESRIKP